MPEIPTTAQLDEIEQRSRDYAAVCAGSAVNAHHAATVTAASADDVPVLLAAVRQLQYERRLLGVARMTLDLVAAGGPDRWEQARREAEDVAQRIVDEIGHPQTDEPALGPDLRAENARLFAKVERLTTAVAAALERGDRLTAELAERDTAQADAPSCPCRHDAEPADGSVNVVVDALTTAAGVMSEERLAGQVAAWVAPCRLPALAAHLAMSLRAAVRQASRTAGVLGGVRAERDEATAALRLQRGEHAELVRWLDSERAAAWRPKAWPVRPLTPEQERSVAADEARTDWPAWVEPCDPAVATDGDTLWLSCTGDEHADDETPTPIRAVEPGDRWSELVAAVVAHRCQPTAATAGTGDAEGAR
jgi:hypothetical protein